MQNLIKELRADSHRRNIEREYRKAYDLITSAVTVEDHMRSRVKRADKARFAELKHLSECYELNKEEALEVMCGMKIK